MSDKQNMELEFNSIVNGISTLTIELANLHNRLYKLYASYANIDVQNFVSTPDYKEALATILNCDTKAMDFLIYQLTQWEVKLDEALEFAQEENLFTKKELTVDTLLEAIYEIAFRETVGKYMLDFDTIELAIENNPIISKKSERDFCRTNDFFSINQLEYDLDCKPENSCFKVQVQQADGEWVTSDTFYSREEFDDFCHDLYNQLPDCEEEENDD